MSSKHKKHALNKIRFSIGSRLITVISFIIIISLGSVTVLISLLGRSNLRITAEANNLETNRRMAAEAGTLLTNTLSNSRVLIQTINAIDGVSVSQTSAVKETTDFFWTENPQIAAVFYVIPGRQEQLLVNSRFFTSRQIDEKTVSSYFDNQKAALGRAVRSETVLQNAAPHFSRAVLALFFPWRGGGVGAVLFAGEDLNKNYGYGVNKSCMINTDGDVISHADFTVIKEKTNVKNMNFIQVILDGSVTSAQISVKADFGVMRSSSGNVNPDILEYIWDNVKSTTRLVVDKSAEILRKYNIVNIDIKPKEKKMHQYVAYTKLSTADAVVITSIEYNKIFKEIDAVTGYSICLTIAVLIISIIFIGFFSKTISAPLKLLIAAARQVENGKFDLNLHSKTRGEIGVLTSGFGKMCSALSVFGKFSNKEAAIKAMRGEIKPGGLAKHGTVFFSDIHDFKVKSENFIRAFGAEASDKIVFWLNEYFTQMVDCVGKTGGLVDKFIGDAVMAHWGTAYSAGSPRKDAFNCVKSALMMRKALFFMNRERRAGDPSNPSIRIGCGINSGVVTAGQLGSDMRMEYTVIGNPVNLASRIKSLSKPLGTDILISEDTWKLVGDKFITEEMPSVPVKGKAKFLRIFAVINFTGEVKGPQSLNEVRSLLGIEPPDLDKVDIKAAFS